MQRSYIIQSCNRRLAANRGQPTRVNGTIQLDSTFIIVWGVQPQGCRTFSQATATKEVNMNKLKLISIIAGLAAVMLLFAACANDDDAPQSENGVSQAAGAFSGGVQGQSGISVSGEGSIDLVPDLALLNVGVEAVSESVSEARDEAAQAMDAVIAAVKAQGLEDRDIQTRSFNIRPQYEYENNRSTLVGYTVSNSATVKIRDIDNVGPIIDDVANAGGNATRIDGIRFTVEDPKPHMATLREAAFQDARAKAEHLATLAGVELGPLTFVTESSGVPMARDAAFETAMLLAGPSTSISEGELQLSMYVQAVFDIR